eukprot:7124474-Pyramimonas_sp.AAC.1
MDVRAMASTWGSPGVLLEALRGALMIPFSGGLLGQEEQKTHRHNLPSIPQKIYRMGGEDKKPENMRKCGES